MRIDTELNVGYVRLVAIDDPSIFVEVGIDLDDEGGDFLDLTAAEGTVCAHCLADVEVWADEVTATHMPPAPAGWRIEDAPASVQ